MAVRRVIVAVGAALIAGGASGIVSVIAALDVVGLLRLGRPVVSGDELELCVLYKLEVAGEGLVFVLGRIKCQHTP